MNPSDLKPRDFVFSLCHQQSEFSEVMGTGPSPSASASLWCGHSDLVSHTEILPPVIFYLRKCKAVSWGPVVAGLLERNVRRGALFLPDLLCLLRTGLFQKALSCGYRSVPRCCDSCYDRLEHGLLEPSVNVVPLALPVSALPRPLPWFLMRDGYWPLIRGRAVLPLGTHSALSGVSR